MFMAEGVFRGVFSFISVNLLNGGLWMNRDDSYSTLFCLFLG